MKHRKPHTKPLSTNEYLHCIEQAAKKLKQPKQKAIVVKADHRINIP